MLTLERDGRRPRGGLPHSRTSEKPLRANPLLAAAAEWALGRRLIIPTGPSDVDRPSIPHYERCAHAADIAHSVAYAGPHGYAKNARRSDRPPDVPTISSADRPSLLGYSLQISGENRCAASTTRI